MGIFLCSLSAKINDTRGAVLLLADLVETKLKQVLPLHSASQTSNPEPFHRPVRPASDRRTFTIPRPIAVTTILVDMQLSRDLRFLQSGINPNRPQRGGGIIARMYDKSRRSGLGNLNFWFETIDRRHVSAPRINEHRKIRTTALSVNAINIDIGRRMISQMNCAHLSTCRKCHDANFQRIDSPLITVSPHIPHRPLGILQGPFPSVGNFGAVSRRAILQHKDRDPTLVKKLCRFRPFQVWHDIRKPSSRKNNHSSAISASFGREKGG